VILYTIMSSKEATEQTRNPLKSRFNKLVVGDAWDINNTNNTKMNIEVIARNTSSITITTRLYFYEDNTRITLPPNKLNRKNYNELFGNAEHESLYFFPANN
jgi:putative ribosome biogenesis GTPase RsgA